MASQHFNFTLTVPAGTAQSAPVSKALPCPGMVVDTITVRLPTGQCSTVGFALLYGGGQHYPSVPGTWEVLTVATEDYEVPESYDSGAWSIVAYNTGKYPHTLTIVLVAEKRRPADILVRSLPIVQKRTVKLPTKPAAEHRSTAQRTQTAKHGTSATADRKAGAAPSSPADSGAAVAASDQDDTDQAVAIAPTGPPYGDSAPPATESPAVTQPPKDNRPAHKESPSPVPSKTKERKG